MGGFGGGSLLSLATNGGVQAELKITDEQKAQIEKLSQESRAKRDKTMQDMRARMERNGGGDNNNNGGRGTRRGNQGSNLPATTGVIQRVSYQPQAGIGGFGGGAAGGFGGGAAAGGFGGNPYTGQQEGVDPALQQRMLQQQQQQMQNQRNQMMRQNGFEQMRQAMDKLTKDDETALAKILDPKQMKRIKEISLQMEGPFAIVRNQALAQKLNVTEEQYSEIQQLEQDSRQQGSGTRDQMRSLMDKVRASMPQDANNGDANANNGGNNNGGRGNNANGGNNNGGRGGRGNFNPEAFRAAMEKPEIQAEMTKIRETENAQRDRNFSKVFAALDRRQSSMYKSMLGEKIDTAALMRGGFGGRGGPGGPPAGGPAAAPNATANANADTAKADATKAAPAAAKADTAKAETPRTAPAAGNANSNSLRARRGIGSTPKSQ